MTTNERQSLVQLTQRLAALKGFLSQSVLPDADSALGEWLHYLDAMKQITGNASNGMSLIGCMMAKEYLSRHLPMKSYDAALKPQGASGLDVDEQTVDGRRVIAEVKTTTPFKENDFGAAQISSFRKDFTKLTSTSADFKFLFVTNSLAFDVLQCKYAKLIPDVSIVLLTPQVMPLR